MLIHKGTKPKQKEQIPDFGLRALLIHKGTKLIFIDLNLIISLRALLIHKGTKLRLRLLQKILLFESFVNS